MASVPAATRRRIIELAQGRCEPCRLPESYSPSPFAVDHIQPRSRSGADDADNLALSCQSCNGAKYNKVEANDPATDALVPLFHPRQQRWSEHFIWSEDTLLALGTTATGRATVGVLHLNREGVVIGRVCAPRLDLTELHLNREGVVNLREVLLLRGLHPPSDD